MPLKRKMILDALQVKPNSFVLLTYFRIVYNFGYVLGLIPFRLKNNGVRCELQVHRGHQIFCAVVHALIMYEYCSMTRFIEWDNLGSDAFNSLHAVAAFACITYGLAFIYTVWFRKGDILKAARLIENVEFFDGTDKWVGIKVNVIVMMICIWFTAFALTDTTFHDNSLINANVSGLFSQAYQDSRVFYLFEQPGADYDSSTLSQVVAVIFTIIHVIIAIPRFLLIQILELMVLMTSLCLWHILHDFLKFKERCGSNSNGDTIFTNYAKLRDLVKATNKAVSILTFSYVGVSLPFYASWTAIIFFHDNVGWKHLIHFYFYFGSFFILLVVAADVNSKCSEFYAWVSIPENSDGVPPNRMTSLVMDMLSNQIALRGSGIFILTYRFIGTILSVILTYTIIIIQFQVSKRGFRSAMAIGGVGDYLSTAESIMSNSSLI